MATLNELYNALKADGAPLQNTYKEFEAYMTAPGKQGYQNRKKMYDALKADGAPLQSTYEEFSRDFFAPVKKPQQSSEHHSKQAVNHSKQAVKTTVKPDAKPQQKPQTKQTASLKTVTPQSLPFNLQSGKPQSLPFNLQSGKPQSQMPFKQFDTTELIEESKAYDPNFKPLTLRQELAKAKADQLRIEYQLNKRRKEIEKEVRDELNKKEKNSSIGMRIFNAINGNDPMLQSKDRYTEAVNERLLTDRRYRSLSAANNKAKKTTETIRREYHRSNGKDAGFIQGFKDVVSDVRTWDFGRGDILDATTALSINKKIESGQELTEEEKTLMQSYATNGSTERRYGRNDSRMYGWGKTAGYIAPFMLDFATMNVTGAMGGMTKVGKKLTTSMLNLAAKKGSEKFARNKATRWTIKALGTMPEELLYRAPLMANTVQAAKTTSDIIDRRLGSVTSDKNGNLKFENEKSWGAAIWQGEANAVIENYSERFGPNLEGLLSLNTASKIANVFGAKRVSSVLSKLGNNEYQGFVATMQKHLNTLGVSDIVGEVGEEYYGQIWRTMLNLDDSKNEYGQNLLLDSNFHKDVWGGMAISMGAMGAFKYGLSGMAYGHYKHQLNKADSRCGILFGDEWDSLRDKIDETSNSEIENVANSVIADDKLTKKQKAAALDYMEAGLRFRGCNLASMAKVRKGVEDVDDNGEQINTPRDVDAEVDSQLSEKYLEGYNEEDAAKKKQLRQEMEQKRKKAVASLDENWVTSIDNDPIAAMRAIEKMEDSELIDIAIDYINAQIAYNGMQQRKNDDLDIAIGRAEDSVDSRTHRQTGALHPVTLKENDRQVYVIDGSLSLTDDGKMVDVGNSDDSIIIMDAQTGKLEFVSAHDILTIGEAIDADIEKQRIRDEITAAMEQQDNDDAEVDGGNFISSDELDPASLQIDDYRDKEDAENDEWNDADNELPVGKTSAVSMIPVDEKGDSVYDAEGVSAEAAWDALLEETGADEQVALDVIADEIKEREAALRKLEKKKAPAGLSTKEKIAWHKQHKSDIESARNNLEHWKAMQGVRQGRKDMDAQDDISKDKKDKIESDGNKGRSLSREEARNLIQSLLENAEVAEDIPLTIDNWDALFGESSEITTPLENVSMGENQFVKLSRMGRNGKLGMVKPTLEHPDLIISESSTAKDGTQTGRPTSHIYVKTFIDKNGERVYHFTSVTVDIQGKEVSISNQEKSPNRIANLLQNGRLIWVNQNKIKIDDIATSETQQEDAVLPKDSQSDTDSAFTDPLGFSSNTSSERKDSASLEDKQEEGDKSLTSKRNDVLDDELERIPNYTEDVAAEARERGFRRDGAERIERQGPINVERGDEIGVKFSRKDMPRGHIALMEADDLQPSHMYGMRNVNHFLDEAQPKERNDANSVVAADEIAGNINPEEVTRGATAYSGRPTINARGEVIQGNNRSAALKIMHNEHPEQAEKYKQYLLEHAEEFGLTREQIESMKNPVLVNIVDVTDDEAIKLGQFTAKDIESGGEERLNAANLVKKLREKMDNFIRLLMHNDNEDATVDALIKANGKRVIEWLKNNELINDTQYESALTGGKLSSKAVDDLKEVLQSTLFDGAPTVLPEIFELLPDRVKKAILATFHRDALSAKEDMMLHEIQQSILAFNAMMQDEQFANAKTYRDAIAAAEIWSRQFSFNDVTGEPTSQSEKFSNFALRLAVMYKSMTTKEIRTKFNDMFDIIQGTVAPTLLDMEPDNTPKSLSEAIKAVLDLEYKPIKNNRDNDDKKGSGVVDSDIDESEKRKRVGQGDVGSGESAAPRAGTEERGRGTEKGSTRITSGITEGDSGRTDNLSAGDAEELDYQISDELDENGRPFVLNSNGEIEFGSIDQNIEAEAGLASAPILLSEGIITNPETNDGYGLIHIEARHGAQIRANGYKTVLEFIEDVAKNWHVIKEAKDRNGNPTYRLIAEDKHNNTLMIELSGDGKYWNINTAGIFKTSYGKNSKTLYNRHTTGKQSAETIEASQESEQSGTTDSSRMFAPATSERKDSVSLEDKQDEGEKSLDKEPTEAQKLAGNYKKEHITIDGHRISIENKKGSVRSGRDADGKEWHTEMHNDYGYIRGTKSVDGDHIDVYLSDNPERGDVFVIDQYNPDGTFDEHKVMYGFSTPEAARAAYLSNYEPGWEQTRRIDITHVSKEDFKVWVQSSKRKTKPVAEYKSVKKMDSAEEEEKEGADDNNKLFDVGTERVPTSDDAEVYDATMGLVASTGVPVVEVSDADAMAMMPGNKKTPFTGLPNRANEKQTSGSVLLSAKGDSSSNSNVPSEATAKIAKDTQRAKNNIKKFNNGDATIETNNLSDAIRTLGALFSMHTKGGSRYTILRTDGGHTIAIRLSDHEANGNNFGQDNAANNLSIVIERRRFDAKPSEIEFTEATIPMAIFEAQPKAVVDAIVKGVEDVLADKPFTLESSLGSVELKGGEKQRFSIRTNRGTSADFERNKTGEINGEINGESKDRVRFLRTQRGVVYGWTVGGKVYLNRDAMNPETPVHEYTHLWDDMVRRENPELWERGKELMKQTPLWDEVKNDPNYADISEDEDAIASEVHSRLTGKKGAERVAQMMEEAKSEPEMVEKAKKISIVHQLKQWLSEMFKGLKKTLSKWSQRELQDLTEADFVNMTLRDLAEGLNPRTEMRRGEHVRSVLESNPMLDDYHTGIREREDVNTFDEILAEAENSGETMYPDMSLETLRQAKEDGYIIVYSSKPIETGAFVTPSRMNAEEYAGGGKVYEKRVPVDDVAWIDDSEGQYTPVQEYETNTARFHAAMSRGREDFDDLRDRAVKERGIVTPGLAEKEVKVVEVPRHDFAGTGKEALKAAEKWAKDNIVGVHTATDSDGIEFEYSISKDSVEKYVSRSATDKSENIGVHLATLKKLPEIISESIEAEIHPDYKKGIDKIRGEQNGINEDALIHRFYGAINIGGQRYRVKTTIKEEGLDHPNTAHSYEVAKIEVFADNSTNTSNGASSSRNERMRTAKLLKGVEKSYDSGVKLLDASEKQTTDELAKEQEAGYQPSLFDFDNETGGVAVQPRVRIRSLFEDVEDVEDVENVEDVEDISETSRMDAQGRADEANKAIDDYVERYSEKYAQYVELTNQAADEFERELIEERMGEVLTDLDLKLEQQLSEYYLSEGNSESDSRRMARDMAGMSRADVVLRLHERGITLEVPQEEFEIEYESESKETRKQIHKTASGDEINFEHLQIGLPPLKPGEFSLTERRFVEDGMIPYMTGKTRIESVEDVAYIFRTLENYAVENVFALFVKDGRPMILHVGSGTQNKSLVDFTAIKAGFDAYGADRVYLVHNHPSGNLLESPQDRNLLSKMRDMFGDDKVGEGVIIDVTSGRYYLFGNAEQQRGEFNYPEYGEEEQTRHKIGQFSQTKYSKDYDFDKLAQIRYSADVAAFVSTRRLGAGAKMGYLLLTHSNSVIGNILTDYEDMGDAQMFAQEVARQAIACGARAVVTYGNMSLAGSDNLKAWLSKLTADSVTLLDCVQIDNNSGQGYKSARDEGILREPRSEYGDKVESNDLLNAVRTLYTQGRDVASKKYQMKFFDVAKTPKFMKRLGLKGEKFTIRYGVIARHLGKDGSHDISISNWENLPEALKSPFAITKLTNANGSDKGFRLYTTLQNDKGEFIVVGVDVKNTGRDLEVNAISTVFGRRENASLTLKEEVIHKDKNITPEQESLLNRPNSDQYPTAQELTDGKVTNSLSDKQKSEDDVLYRSSAEIEEEYPNWLDGTTTESGKHTTQVEGTRKTYRKLGDWILRNLGMDVSILDASSGMGYGAMDLRDRGFNVEDVEPYQSEKRKAENPATYDSYDKIRKQYDVVISNAVLNVVPDDVRRSLLHNMVERLNDGGKLFINTRKAGEERNIKDKIELDNEREVLVKRNGKIASYQRFFTPTELREWISEELGDDYKVEVANEQNSGTRGLAAVVVTKEQLNTSAKQKRERIEKLRRSEPVVVTGEEIEYSKNNNEFKKNAIEYAKKLQGVYTNADTKEKIQLQRGRRNGGIKEVLQHDLNDRAHIQSIAAIPQIIEQSILISEEDNYDKEKNPRVSKYQHFVCGLKIGGVDYTVHSIIAVDKAGDRYYDHKLSHIEKGKLLNFIEAKQPLNRILTPMSGTEPTIRSQRKIMELIKLLQIDGEEVGEELSSSRMGAQSNVEGSESEEPEMMRSGTGEKSDSDVSWENDPWSRAFGESLRSRRQQREYAQRERRRMRERAEKLSKKLGLNIEILERSEGLEGKKARAKGWFNKRTGKITIVLGNHTSSVDVEKTILHEAVAHKGLREMFGEHFDEFLDKVYSSAVDEIKERIDLLASRNGWNRRLATEEYLAGLAEDTDIMRHDVMHFHNGWFSKVKMLFIKMLNKVGFKNLPDDFLTDNELKWLLWYSYGMLEDNSVRGIMWEARKAVVRDDLGLNESGVETGKSAEEKSPLRSDNNQAEDGDELFRNGDFTPHDRVMARQHYEDMLKKGLWQAKEAVQDSMLGLKTLYESILGKGSRIEDVSDFENAYLYENAMSSANLAQQQQYAQRFFHPLLEQIAKICGKDESKRRELSDYLIAKHGLERNAYMRQEASNNGEETDRDFAGLCGLTGEQDWQIAEQRALDVVDEFERDNDVSELWDSINAATQETLNKLWISGIISDETYNKVISMYQFYVPLRGWDETTSDEIYEYITDKNGPLQVEEFWRQ